MRGQLKFSLYEGVMFCFFFLRKIGVVRKIFKKNFFKNERKEIRKDGNSKKCLIC